MALVRTGYRRPYSLDVQVEEVGIQEIQEGEETKKRLRPCCRLIYLREQVEKIFGSDDPVTLTQLSTRVTPCNPFALPLSERRV